MGLLARGQMGQHFRRIDLRKVDPARTAAGELGQGTVLFCDAADQFAGLLHNGEVGGKVGIQHIVSSQCPQQGYHFSFHKGTRLHTEFLSQSSTDCRGSADNYNLFWISNGLFHLGAFVPFGDAVHRTDIGTLTAVNTDGFSSGFFQSIGSMYPDQVGAGSSAHTAADTFFFPAYNTGIVLFNGNTDR